ncbi:MAG: fused MFS/spermidine synthase [Chloroflexota bacterium]|nr:fused MFS/spermidine synthase [Dehalococcoidia bacterium]MDW8253969.1 fused MFS/spermidine synthase [Chloroflexota bacterium]
MVSTSTLLRTALPWLLALSLIATGASGLIYQVVWFRLLGTIFGVTVQATSAVLAAFMAGLALGSFLAARVADRLRDPLRGYGLVEIGIGIAGLASLPLLDGLQPLYRSTASVLGEGNPLLIGLRFALGFLVMMIPTTLMGTTLPLVVRASALHSPAVARNIGLLYAGNTLGAIVGAFTAGFFLIGVYGLTVAVAVAAAFNIGIGVTWAVAARGLEPLAPPPETGRAPALPDPLRPNQTLANVVLGTYALSGATALANEVIWTRVLSGIFPGTVYAFTLMLCAILAGIALGSWLVTPFLQRARNWALVYAGCQLGLAVTALLSIATLASAFQLEGLLGQLLGVSGGLLLEEPAVMALIAFAAIGPAAIAMGVTFPVAARLYASTSSRLGDRVGRIYGANTLGAIAGSLAGGLILIPLVGAERALWLTALGNAVIALLVLGVAPGQRRVRAAIALAGAVSLAGTALLTPSLYAKLSATDPRGERTIWLAEGPDATVRVVRNPSQQQILYINSEGQASDDEKILSFHYLLGHLGLLLHPRPRDVLAIGLGGGATPGAAALHERATVTVVELYPGVIEGARFFREVNFGIHDRPNVRMIVNDGRNFLMFREREYDVIVADIIRAKNAGAANLYSADYYRLARQALRDDGMMVQWIDDTLPEYAYKLMVRTFLTVFPETTMWFNGSVLIGTKQPLRLDRLTVEENLQQPGPRQHLARLGFHNSYDVLREYVAGPDEIRAYVGEGPIITDRHPSIEFMRTLPTDGGVADLRWERVARFVAAFEEPTDAAVFTHAGVRWQFHRYHREMAAEYQAPWPLNGRNAEVARELQRLLDRHRRVWYVPAWQSDSDIFVERWLSAAAYRALDTALGNTRVLLFLSAAGEPAPQARRAEFGQRIRLTAWAIDRTELAPGEFGRILLDWETIAPLDDNYKTSLRLVDERGRLIAEVNRQPRDQESAGLGAGFRWRERTALLIPPGTPPGDYRLETSVYREDDGQPLRPTAGAADGRVILGRLTVRPSDRAFAPEAIVADTHPRLVRAGLRLAGLSISTLTARPGDLVGLTTFWQPVEPDAAATLKIVLGEPARPLAQLDLRVGEAGRPVGTVQRLDRDLRIPPATPPGRYDLWLADGGQPAWLGRLAVVARPPLPPPSPPAITLNAPVGDFATLIGATVTAQSDRLEVRLVWQARKETERNATVFVHVLDAANRILTQSDQLPAGGAAPTTAWLPGQAIEDLHLLRIGEIPPESRVIVGLYDSATLIRFPIGESDFVVLPWPSLAG